MTRERSKSSPTRIPRSNRSPSPQISVRLDGADRQWGKDPLQQLLVGLDSLRAPESGNRPGRSLVIKPTQGG